MVGVAEAGRDLLAAGDGQARLLQQALDHARVADRQRRGRARRGRSERAQPDRRALLVLDNCEHLVNAVAVLTEFLLSVCPNLTVLLTSRVRLVVPHETVYQVPGLSVPAAGEQDGGDAIALFAERAAAAGTPLPDGAARQRAAGICRALDGLPLAIELAAARLPSLGLDGLEAGLADR